MEAETIEVAPARRAGAFRLRPHQQKIARAVLDDLRRGEEEVVLAACPGFGKTETAIHVVRTLLREGRIKRALVLAHGTTVLRTNFQQRLVSRAPELLDRMVVRIPQEHRQIEGDFDLLVMDEAHEFYEVDQGMVERIREKVGAKQALLLTGTPSRFIRRKVPALHAFPLFDLIKEGWASDVRVLLAESAYRIGEEDWNEDGEVRKEIRYGKKATDKTIDDLLDQLRGDVEVGRDPTIFACKSIEMAGLVSKALARRQVRRLVSENEEDPSSANVSAFRTGDCPALVVVKRATLGFDMPGLVNFIDLTGSRNPDRIFQMLCRLVRVPENGARTLKTFVKVMPKAFSGEPLRYFMSGVLSLGAREFFTTWDGGALYRMRVPVGEATAAAGIEGDGVPRRRPVYESGMMMFGDFFERTGDRAITTLGRCLGRYDPEIAKKELLLFVRQRGRRPSQHCPAEIGLFARMSKWTSPSSSRYDATLRAELEKLCPTVSQDPEGKKQRILAFASKNGRRPSSKSSSPEERKMAGHLYVYSCISSRYYDERFVARLEHVAPSSDGRRRQWKREVLVFTRRHGRRPSVRGTPQEKRLYQRMKAYTQRSSPGFDATFRRQLEALAPIKKADKRSNRRAVVEFVKANGRRPALTSANEEERRLAYLCHGYCSPSSSNYCPAVARQVRRLATVRPKQGVARLIEVDGRSKTARGWARETGLSSETIRTRFLLGIRGRDLLAPGRSGLVGHSEGEKDEESPGDLAVTTRIPAR